MIGFTNEERMAVITAHGYTVKPALEKFTTVERYSSREGFYDEELSVHVLRVFDPKGQEVVVKLHPDSISRLCYVDHVFWGIYKNALMKLMTKSKKSLAL